MHILFIVIHRNIIVTFNLTLPRYASLSFQSFHFICTEFGYLTIGLQISTRVILEIDSYTKEYATDMSEKDQAIASSQTSPLPPKKCLLILLLSNKRFKVQRVVEEVVTSDTQAREEIKGTNDEVYELSDDIDSLV